MVGPNGYGFDPTVLNSNTDVCESEGKVASRGRVELGRVRRSWTVTKGRNEVGPPLTFPPFPSFCSFSFLYFLFLYRYGQK